MKTSGWKAQENSSAKKEENCEKILRNLSRVFVASANISTHTLFKLHGCFWQIFFLTVNVSYPGVSNKLSQVEIGLKNCHFIASLWLNVKSLTHPLIYFWVIRKHFFVCHFKRRQKLGLQSPIFKSFFVRGCSGPFAQKSAANLIYSIWRKNGSK